MKSMFTLSLLASTLLGSTLLVGCADDGDAGEGGGDGATSAATGGGDSSSGDGGGAEGGGGEGGGVDPDPTIAFEVVLRDGNDPDTVLAGVEVCAADRPDVACATSGDDGRVALALPADSELMLRCASDTHGPAYMTWAIGDQDVDAGSFGLLSKTLVKAGLQLGGAEHWPELGAITVNVYEDLVERDVRVAAATFTIQPDGGLAYVGENGLPDPELEASTVGGPGVFFDLAEGEVTVSITHPTRTCTGGFGWPTGDATSLRSRIFPGGLSNVTFVCPP